MALLPLLAKNLAPVNKNRRILACLPLGKEDAPFKPFDNC